MTDSDLEAKLARNREDRYRQLLAWADYVASSPDEEWGRQVNSLVDSQLQSARYFQDERPDLAREPESRDE